MMSRYALVLAFTTMLISPALAQDRVHPRERPASANGAVADADGVIHISDVLNSTPEALAALEEFRTRKRLGLLPRNQRVSLPKTGSLATFRVLNLETREWSDAQFELKGQAAGGSIQCQDEAGTRTFQNAANVWVEVGESAQGNGHVEDSDAEAIADALVLSTPAGSIDQSSGSITNNTLMFGCPPDIDGDGTLDVLVYDIIDAQQGGFVAGFVSSADLTSTGNNRDVLHIDSNEGIFRRSSIEGALGTAAHEYQHLIHFNFDPSEISFVNEGLSEWAEVMNGYTARSMSYLSSAAELNQALFTWRGTEAAVLNDYQRAGLFISYLAHRFGPEFAGSITREPSRGLLGLQNSLDRVGFLVRDAVVDFHTATLLNDTGLTNEKRFNLNPGHAGEHVRVSRTVDGRLSETNSFTETVIDGGAAYRAWTNVQDLVLTAAEDTTTGGGGGGGPEKRNENARLRAVIDRNGSLEIRDLDPDLSPFTFTGTVDWLALLVANQKVQEPHFQVQDFKYRFTSTWATSGVTTVTVRYDNGRVSQDDSLKAIYVGQAPPRGVATRFSVQTPERASLDKLQLAVYYLSQFGGTNVDDSEPRDFTLGIYDVDATSGGPGNELFSRVVTDPRAYTPVFVGDVLKFATVDMAGEDLGTLPDEIIVTITNAGSDPNTIVVALSDYSTESVSYLFDGVTWSDMWLFELVGPPATPLENRMAPMRATFLVQPAATAIEETAELPDRVRLEQSYPNPFNPTTTIRFALPQTADVELVVYDVLGRRVATLAQGLRAAGEHELTLVASSWASGIYVYTLRTGSVTLTRNMLLVK